MDGRENRLGVVLHAQSTVNNAIHSTLRMTAFHNLTLDKFIIDYIRTFIVARTASHCNIQLRAIVKNVQKC